MELPPGAEMRGGRLVRIVPRTAADGKVWEEVRPVSLDPHEARAQRMDFYHPQFGWLREGYKKVTDRSVGSIMMDESQAVAVHEEDRPAWAGSPEQEKEEN